MPLMELPHPIRSGDPDAGGGPVSRASGLVSVYTKSIPLNHTHSRIQPPKAAPHRQPVHPPSSAFMIVCEWLNTVLTIIGAID